METKSIDHEYLHVFYSDITQFDKSGAQKAVSIEWRPRPLMSKSGTYKTVKAKFWRLQINVFKPVKSFPLRSAAAQRVIRGCWRRGVYEASVQQVMSRSNHVRPWTS